MSCSFGHEHTPAEHDHARELAAIRLDEPLAFSEAAWLHAHLAGCGACAAVAAAYDEGRLALRGLRENPPQPPRDLWARTAAAIDRESTRAPRPAQRRRGRRFGLLPLAPIAGLLVIAVAVGAGLLNGVSLVPGGGTSTSPTVAATPITLAAGDVRVLTRGDDGTLLAQTLQVDEVCPTDAATCGLRPSIAVSQVPGVDTSAGVDGILSPAQDRIVLFEHGDGSRGVFVVPVRAAGAESSPTATPEPTSAATATVAPTPTPTPSMGPGSTAKSTGEAPTASDAASSAPANSGSPSLAPSESPSEAPSSSPAATPEPTPTPATTGEPTPATSGAPTAAPTADLSPEPTATVQVTPAPNGAIEIARDVIVVGNSAAYSPDGTLFAFAARPADGSRGPDVFVWDTSTTRAHAVTRDHRSEFSGWLDGGLLVSRAVDGQPRTFHVDPVTGDARLAHHDAAWQPTVSPDGSMAVWWDGTIRLADDGVTWVPGDGRLVLGSWPLGDGAEQVLLDGPLADWQVRWDETGTVLAVWEAGAGGGRAGSLSLYTVDPATRHAQLDKPLLEDAPASSGFSLRAGRVAWSAPGSGGDATVHVLAWKGDKVGRLELPAEGGATVVH